MVKPDQIIKGEATYTLDEFYQDLKNIIYKIEVPDEAKKEKGFQSLFMFIMLSAEDKPVELLMDIFNFTKEQITEQQEAFREQIDTCRAIHMKKFLDIYTEYMAGTAMTLRILNIWIQQFLKEHIKEAEHDTA